MEVPCPHVGIFYPLSDKKTDVIRLIGLERALDVGRYRTFLDLGLHSLVLGGNPGHSCLCFLCLRNHSGTAEGPSMLSNEIDGDTAPAGVDKVFCQWTVESA